MPEKKVRVTTSGAIEELCDGLDHFTEIFAVVGSGCPTGVEATPVCKTKTIVCMEKFGTDLTDIKKLDLTDLFTKNVAMADTYLSIESEGLCKM